jgi:tellurite resistance protein TerC
VAVECSDILFAVDSVAAALSITHDRFGLYSANIFAILGLRALYLLLASLIRDWPYLHYGIALVLAFTAIKRLLEPVYAIPIWMSLGVIVGSVTVAIAASVRANRRARQHGRGLQEPS